jgi:hypothetical protein
MILKLTLRELLADLSFVAFGIVCLKLAFNRQIAPGSVPNVYLLVLGIAFFVTIPIFHIYSCLSRDFLVSMLLSYLIAVVLVTVTLVVCVLNGSV